MLRFDDCCIERPRPAGLDAVTDLEHFAIITYALPCARLAGFIHPRFRLDTIEIDGVSRALLSVVPFVDINFGSAVFPAPRFRMGQTNYRVYVIDNVTNRRCVWFLGTTLDSWTVLIPRYLWKLPWYRGKISFRCDYDAQQDRYTEYAMHTESEWAAATLLLLHTAGGSWPPKGFPDEESALVCLTHPLQGYYYRQDGRLGSYSVWHERIAVTPAQVHTAKFSLLDRLGLVPFGEQMEAHSVLLARQTRFTVYLPPHVVV